MMIFNIETLRFRLQILGESVSESHEYSTAKEPIVVFFFAKVASFTVEQYNLVPILLRHPVFNQDRNL